MLSDKKHDLIQQISEISDGLWRIKNDYIKNAGDDELLAGLWKELESEYERQLELMESELKRQLMADSS